MASRNANDGISLAQVAEGALGKVGDMLQRMRELAVQASNATNSVSDRKALQAEVSQLRDEIDRVAKQTSFNGKKVLDGTFAGAVFQVGANSGENITVGALTDSTAKGLSTVSYGTASASGAALASGAGGFGGAVSGLSITVAGSPAVNLEDLEIASSSSERLGQVVAAINKKTDDTGVTAFLTTTANGAFEIELRSSRVDDNGDALTATLAGFSAATTGIGAASTTATNGEVGIEEIDVTTQADAWVTLKKIDDAIDQINSSRADLGALQTRFENSVNNIDIMTENLSASRGRIVDADFAKETANLSRTQILQQAGVAMVAQSNQLPQQVLSLLR